MHSIEMRLLVAAFVFATAIVVRGDRQPFRATYRLGAPLVGVPPATVPISRFASRMPIPPVLEPSSREGGVTTYDLAVQKGTTAFFPGISTETYGYNAGLLGPTIRLRRGERVSIRIANGLTRQTNIHWHGMRIPADADGPHHDIDPGQTFTSTFSVMQPAATLWYHPHSSDSGFQVFWGLAGYLYVDDDAADALPLPREYGVDDFPLIVQDKHFFSGTLSYTMQAPEEATEERVLGEEILVNGAINPYLDVPQGTVRLRLLNGSDARRYNFALEDGRTFFVIGSDGGLLPAPVPVTNLELAPAERAEILVDFSRDRIGSRLKLISRQFHVESNETGPFITPYIVRVGGEERTLISPVSMGQQYPVMELRVARPGRSLTVPDRLVPVETIPETSAQTTRVFDMEPNGEEQTINGLHFDMNRIDVRVPAGATEIWDIHNSAPDFSHSFHIHGIQFRVLDRTLHGRGVPLPAPETGWKDTVVVHPSERVRVIGRFNDLSGLYMYHCHVLQHENRGMMGTFEVTGATPLASNPQEHNHAH